VQIGKVHRPKKLEPKIIRWMFKGEAVPAGSYVYLAEMSCNEKTFTQNGSVMVMYWHRRYQKFSTTYHCGTEFWCQSEIL